MIYLILFLEFFKVGLFSVGGGLAALPLLQELVRKYGWISEEQLLDLIAISESTPGPIGINAATFVGYQAAHIPGGIVATLGIIAPSLILITILAGGLQRLHRHPAVNGVFGGIRPAVAGLIGAVALDLGKSELISAKALVLFLIMLAAMNRVKAHPVVFLAGAAVIGMVFRY